MAEFFIRRPIVAIVISIIIVIMGAFTLKGLSFEMYPFLAPPLIRVTANYVGASAVAVEQSVATPIEQEVNGVEGMIYMKSSNTSDGRMQLDVNFEVGTNQDTANVLTQNRVSSAQARLPQEVIAQGVTVKKQSPSILMIISVYSPKGTYDGQFLINYCSINLRDQLLRIPGVAQVDLFGGADLWNADLALSGQAGQFQTNSCRCYCCDQRTKPASTRRSCWNGSVTKRSSLYIYSECTRTLSNSR
jgi:HAE1 family hydrophobic/amphiphilic exporter-1